MKKGNKTEVVKKKTEEVVEIKPKAVEIREVKLEDLQPNDHPFAGKTSSVQEIIKSAISQAKLNGHRAVGMDLDSVVTKEAIEVLEAKLSSQGIRCKFYEKGGKEKVEFKWR